MARGCFPFTPVQFDGPECDRCGIRLIDFDAAVNAGWIPSYIDAATDEEVSESLCPACQKRLGLVFNSELGDFELPKRHIPMPAALRDRWAEAVAGLITLRDEADRMGNAHLAKLSRDAIEAMDEPRDIGPEHE